MSDKNEKSGAYTAPKLEIIRLDCADIITTSSPGGFWGEEQNFERAYLEYEW